jgi:hypothetical protein
MLGVDGRPAIRGSRVSRAGFLLIGRGPPGENEPVKGVSGFRALRVANPLVRVVLESRAHRLLSGRLLVLVYRGHRSGREFRIPLRYAESGSATLVAVALHPERKQWWRSFATPARATLVLQRERVEVRGAIGAGDVRETLLEAYLDRYPRSRRIAEGAAVVVFERLGR